MSLDLPIRPRRNRKSAVIRDLCRETRLTTESLVYPLFVHDGATEPIDAMPGQKRHSVRDLVNEIGQCMKLGVRAFALFPKIPDSDKSPDANEALNPDGLIPTAIKAIKDAHPDSVIITDVALDPYNSDGHDGVVQDGKILNDPSVEILCEQAVIQAEAGADIVAPSDMMDGRVGAIRFALDDTGHEDVSILAYTAKYASAFYGPFRGALDSAPRAGDKKTYQMDPANVREAMSELELDISEGADMVMVKPAGAYLDIVSLFRDKSSVPVAAYQVSGEYLMLKAASQAGWLDEAAAVDESLLGIKRAGADIILTYFARDFAQRHG